ncbi:MAG: response regulator [Candidatus Hodarchaeota archaeon]
MTSRILLIDDDKDFLHITTKFLTRDAPDFEFIAIASPIEALRRVQEEEFDVIVSDYQMPPIDGLELLEWLRTNGNDIPFILFTGKGREEVAIRALNLGATYYVTKGGDPKIVYAELIHLIKNAVLHKKTIDALVESEKRFHQTFEANPDQAYLYEYRPDGQITLAAVNKASRLCDDSEAANFVGYDLNQLSKDKEAVGKFLKHGIDLHGLITNIKLVLDTGRPLRMEKAYEFSAEERRWFIIDYAKISDNLVLLTSKDVTELKQAEEVLHESEFRCCAILDSMGDLIHVVDRELRFIFLNATFSRQNKELGLKTDVVGQSLHEVFPFLPEKVIGEYHLVLETGKLLVTEEQTEVGNRVFITQTRKIPVFENGEITKILTIIRDFTGVKKMEQALQKCEERKQMLEMSLRKCAIA